MKTFLQIRTFSFLVILMVTFNVDTFAYIDIVQPNGGEVWARGSTQDIVWTGYPSAVIDLFNGHSFIGTIAVNATSPYHWTITAPAGAGYFVVITAMDGNSQDWADGTFTITDTNPVNLTSPTGGESWISETAHNITWTEGSGTVDIDLYDSSGTHFYGNIATGAISPYLWTIDSSIPSGANYRIKITDCGDASTDMSDSDFTIAPQTLNVSTPGTSLVRGETYTINWTDNVPWPVNIYTSTDMVNFVLIGSNIPDGTNSWDWHIPDNQLLGTTYKVGIVSANNSMIYDWCDDYFSIVTQTIHVSVPNVPGIKWNLESDHLITWTDNVESVKIELLNVTSGNLTLISSSETGNNYNWHIPDNLTIGNHYKILITSNSDPDIHDLSDFEFRIDAASNSNEISIIQPSDAGIHLVTGNSYLISWTDNLTSPVKIELVNFDSPVTTETLFASVEGSTIAWTISQATAPGTHYKIMISSAADNGVIDLSDNEFEISDTPAETNIIVLNPAAGLTWIRGSSYLISWLDNVPDNVVDIVLCNAAGDELATIKSGATGSTWVWTVPLTTYPVGNYKIKVVYNSKSGISPAFELSDTSEGSTVEIYQPNVSGITWLRGSVYLISWADFWNYQGTFDIYYYRNVSPFTETEIASNITGTTYLWTIPMIPESVDYKIKIYRHGDHTISGVSANTFAIMDYLPGGTIDILQPDGGETWTKGNSYLISWIDNIAENVMIDLVNYAGAPDIIPLFASVSGSTIGWTIPNTGSITPGILYKMRVSSTESGLFEESDGYFTIVAPAAPVIYPNPADQFITVQMNEEVSENCNLIITDRFNIQFVNRSVDAQGIKELRISTAELPDGIYFLTLTSGIAIKTHKFIVQH
jgi:hypothetical protein